MAAYVCNTRGDHIPYVLVCVSVCVRWCARVSYCYWNPDIPGVNSVCIPMKWIRPSVQLDATPYWPLAFQAFFSNWSHIFTLSVLNAVGRYLPESPSTFHRWMHREIQVKTLLEHKTIISYHWFLIFTPCPVLYRANWFFWPAGQIYGLRLRRW